MNYTKNTFLVGMLMASIALLLAYGIELLWVGAITAIGLGFLGWLGQYKQKWPWTIDLFLAGVVILVTIGVLLGLRLYLLLPAILGALTAWDLARFQRRTRKALISAAIRKIEKRHLSLLALSLGSGVIFAGVVLTVRVPISYGVALVISVVLIISFGQIYRMLTN